MARSSTSGQGRPKGSQNKLTRDLKEMILGALEAQGGQRWLERQMAKHPKAFMSLLGRTLPLQHTGEGGGPILGKVAIEFVSPNA